MSAENVELVRRGFAAWERGDLDTVGAMLDPEISWHGGDPSAVDACHNRDEAVSFMRRRAPRGIRLIEVIDAGERLVAITQPPAADGELPPRRANVTTVRNGLVTEMVGYESPGAALAAAGVEPPRATGP
jgi:ketosteroid isomerase-like protein